MLHIFYLNNWANKLSINKEGAGLMKNLLQGAILFYFIGAASLVQAETKVFFSPNGACQETVVSEINKAHRSIDIAMYSFTSREIAQELVKAKERKVKIRIVLDKGQKTENYSKSRYLLALYKHKRTLCN